MVEGSAQWRSSRIITTGRERAAADSASPSSRASRAGVGGVEAMSSLAYAAGNWDRQLGAYVRTNSCNP